MDCLRKPQLDKRRRRVLRDDNKGSGRNRSGQAVVHSASVTMVKLYTDAALTYSQPRITDFGLAKCIADDSKQTATGQILGTPSFMPPEQAIGDNDSVDVRSDVYALGGLLYTMLTGRPPFLAETAVATVMQVVNDEPVSLRRLNPDIDRDLETICLKCLEKNPHARYATASEVGAECERYLNRHPIHARPISALARGGRWCHRNPIVTVLAVSVAVVLLLGTVISTYFAIQSSNNAEIAGRNAQQAIDNLSLVQEQKGIAESNALKAKRSEEKAVAQAALLRTRTALLRQSIHSYLKMYQNTCAIGGDIAAANDVERAFTAFERFDSHEQVVMNSKILNAKEAIRLQLTAWKEHGGPSPEAVNFAVLELTKQCRLAWENRCDAISPRRRGQPSSVIRDLERQLVVQDLYDRAILAARGLVDAGDIAAAQQFRDEFEKLYWGELHFVESERLNSSAVESAMIRIRKCLERWNAGLPPIKLAKLVSDLESACQDSLTSEDR